MTELRLLCEICGDREPPIGTFDLEDLVYPITGAMFKSPDPGHEVPPPFDARMNWAECKCKRCGKRPFLTPDRVLTNIGFIDVPPPGPDGKRPMPEANYLHVLFPEPQPELTSVTTITENEGYTVVEVIQCPTCGKVLKSEHALKIHIGRVHK